MGRVFDGYDEYGRPIYIDLAAEHKRTKPLAEAEIIEVIDKRRPLLFLDIETVEVDYEAETEMTVLTELCVHCGVRVIFDGRLDVWFHYDGDVNCEGSGWPAAPTTWKVS